MDETLVILLIIAGALLSPILARLFHVPVAIAEIGYGLLIGNALGYRGSEFYIVDFLSEFGFLLLMFLAGLEADFNLIEKLPSRQLLFYFIYPPLITLISTSLLYYIGKPAIIGTLLSVIAIGLAFSLIKELGLTDTDVGKNIIIIGGIGEIWSLLILTFIDIYGVYGFNMEGIMSFTKILFLFISLFIFFNLLKLLVWWFPEVFQKLMYEKDPTAMGIRISLVLMFSLALITSYVGTESILGAFIGGILMSYFLRKKENLVEKLSAFGYGFLIPIFFITFGMDTDIEIFLKKDTIGYGILFTVMLILVRFVALPYLKILKMDLSKSVLVTLSLSFPFTLLIVGSEIAFSTGLIGDDLRASLLLCATLSSIIFPWIAKLIVKTDKILLN